MSVSQETKKRFSKADISRFGFTLSELPADKTTSSSAKSNFSVTAKLFIPCFMSTVFMPFLDFFSTSILSLVSSSLSCSHTVREFSPSQEILIVNDAKAIFPAFITGSVTSNTRSPLGRQPLSLEMISSNGKLSSSSLTSIHSFTPLKPSESGNGNVANGCGLNPSVCQIGILLLCNARSIHRLRSRCEI